LRLSTPNFGSLEQRAALIDAPGIPAAVKR